MYLRKSSLSDIVELQNICVKAYSANFHSHWEEGGLEWYLEKEFSLERLSSDIAEASISYYFIVKNEIRIGFVKIQENSLPGFVAEEGRELVKMYILPAYKGQGIGKQVLGELIQKAQDQGKKIFFLCVIDTNSSAIAFYKKMGLKFHSKMRLDLPYFKEELRGMDRMYREFS